MRKRSVRLYRLNEDGRKLAAGKIEASNPDELVGKWIAFLATAERGVYFGSYRGIFIGPEPALEHDGGALAT
jgi:hypothetical protein